MNPQPFTTLKISGNSLIASLMQQRNSYLQSGDYPFLIGEADDVERLQEAADYNEQSAEEYELNEDDTLGEWPGDIAEKGAISLHRDILTSEVRPEVYLGLTKIAQPWHLPAALKFGGWEDCPDSRPLPRRALRDTSILAKRIRRRNRQRLRRSDRVHRQKSTTRQRDRDPNVNCNC